MRAFKKGLHPGNTMTHTEKLGRLAVVYFAMSTEDVSAFIIKNGNKKSFPEITKEYYIRILQLLERTLGINSFLKAETMERIWIRDKNEEKRSNENHMDATVKIEPGEPDSNEPLATKYFRQYMRHMQEVFPKQQGTPFKVLQVRKNDTIYFNGYSKGKRYQWLLENDLLIKETVIGRTKKIVRNEDTCMKFLDLEKVVQLMGFEVSIRGNGWNIPKFHAFLHLVRPIGYMGVPENYNGARSESNLIENIKKPARRTNKHGATITFQTMLRYGEQRTRNVAYAMLSEGKETHTTAKEFATDESSSTSSFQIMGKNYTVCGSSFSISFKKNTDSNDGYCVTQWEGRQKTRHLGIPKPTLEYLCERLFTRLNQGGGKLLHTEKIKCLTELNIDGTTIRCHPNYKSDGEWFDWITINWVGEVRPVPAKVVMIIDFRSSKFMCEHELKAMFGNDFVMDHDQEPLKNSVYLVVKSLGGKSSANEGLGCDHSTLSGDKHKFQCRLSKTVEYENDGLYRLVNVNMIICPSIFVLENAKVFNDETAISNYTAGSKDNPKAVVITASEEWSFKAFLEDEDYYEKYFHHCSNNDTIPDAYYIGNKPDHCVRYLCNAKGEVTSKDRQKQILYRNELPTTRLQG